MTQPPTGTVTFLFTDIEGSTRILQGLGDTKYAQMLESHRGIVQSVIDKEGGQEISSEGDAFFIVFSNARRAVTAALSIQKVISLHRWPSEFPVQLRMGLHTGEAITIGATYVGLDVHRAHRIAAAGHGGQILLSDAARIIVEHDLPQGAFLRDLGLHQLKDLLRAEHIFQVANSDLRTDFPPPNSIGGRRHNLPTQTTPLVGRREEIETVLSLLGPGGRRKIVTLTGLGGLGKTRLALQVGVEALERFKDGVFFVNLSTTDDARLVLPAVARSLGLLTPGIPTQEAVKNYLRGKNLLLLLDGFQGVLEGGSSIVRLLQEVGDGIRVLVTSTRSLNLMAEVEYPVPPLPFPRDVHPTVEQLLQYDSVRLFVERALAIRLDFKITTDSTAPLAEIVRRLDGIPIAIELAARRLRVLTLTALAEGLRSRRLDLLRAGARDMPSRQRALEDVIAWQLEPLVDDERWAFRRLSVFLGGCTLEAADWICAAKGRKVNVLDVLQTLVDNSLIQQKEQADGKPRYVMLDTIREFGLKELIKNRELRRVRHRHADFFLRMSAGARSGLVGPNQVEWLARLTSDYDNIRAALNWSIETGEVEVGLKAARGVYRFWYFRGLSAEGGQLVGELLDRSKQNSKEEGGTGLIVLAELLRHQGDYQGAQTAAEKARSIFADLDDKGSLGDAFHVLGLVAEDRGDRGRASVLFEQALEIRKAIGDKAGMAATHNSLGNIAKEKGNSEVANEHYQESLRLWRQIGDPWGQAGPLYNMGSMARHRKNWVEARVLLSESHQKYEAVGSKLGIAAVLTELAHLALDEEGKADKALKLFEEALSMFREIGYRREAAGHLISIGNIIMRSGKLDIARAYFREAREEFEQLGVKDGLAAAIGSIAEIDEREGLIQEAEAGYTKALRLFVESQNTEGVIECFQGLASVVLRTNPLRATRLLGAADALRRSRAILLNIGEGPSDLLEKLRQALDPSELERAWNKGAAMTYEQSIDFALHRHLNDPGEFTS